MILLRKYLRYARRYPVPLWAGFSVLGSLQVIRVYRRSKDDSAEIASGRVDENGLGTFPGADGLAVRAYKALPLNTLSRIWGRVNELELPRWARKPILGLYVRVYGCRMDEAVEGDVTKYRNLGELFRRRLRPGTRPYDSNPLVVASPCDGVLLDAGPVADDTHHLEDVKGVRYPLKTFLGEAELPRNNRKLWQCVIYLAPGDYHGFHAPTDWTVTKRSYFPGYLLSVRPSALRRVKNLLALNERVVYTGVWGPKLFFSMSAVGATNVGSIVVPSDPELQTNDRDEQKDAVLRVADFSSDGGLRVSKGEFFGSFHLGSTIVLVFEGDCELTAEVGQRVKAGQSLVSLLRPHPHEERLTSEV